MRLFLFSAVLVLSAGVGAVIYGASRARIGRARANRVVPGVATRAPRSWAGAHTPEARLHRRLRDLVAGVRQAAAVTPAVDAVEGQVRHLALRLDDQLVAAAALAGPGRKAAVERVAKAVEQLEQAVAELVETAGRGDVDQALEDIDRWVEHLAQARAELDED